MKRDIYLSEDFDTDSTDPSQMYQSSLTIEGVGQVVLESKAIVAVIGDYLDGREKVFDEDGKLLTEASDPDEPFKISCLALKALTELAGVEKHFVVTTSMKGLLNTSEIGFDPNHF